MGCKEKERDGGNGVRETREREREGASRGMEGVVCKEKESDGANGGR